MTIEEKKIAVSLKVGWTWRTHDRASGHCWPHEPGYPMHEGWWVVADPKPIHGRELTGVPNWPGSLDAMHELECFLVTDHDTCHQYAIFLEDIVQKWMLKHPQECKYGDLWFWTNRATAAQRFEAFGLTMGLWKEGE
jgi:hypothetical protein